MSVTVHGIPREATLQDVNEFLVPTILSFSLKKTPEGRSPTLETDNLSNLQNGDLVTEEDEDLMKMSPRRKGSTHKGRQQTSSFLLEPFLKPVGGHSEDNKENPVLSALFGAGNPGLSQWAYMRKTSINNCHPFKKTEFSHDLAADDTPVQVPQSLTKKQSKHRKSPSKRDASPETKPPVLKEVQLYSGPPPKTAASAHSLNEVTPHALPPQSQSSAERNVDLSIFNKRKKIISQSNISTPKPRVQYVNSERLIQLRAIVDNAIKNHKVYSMTGCYSSVRNALKQRGWIEKIDSDVKGRRKVNRFEDIGFYDAAFQFVQKYQTVAAMRLSVQTNSGFAHNDQIHYTGQGEAEIMNRMLKNVTEDLCWLSRPYPYYCYKDFDKFEMVNRLPRAYFSNKVGLCNSLQQIQWFYETGVCSTQFPRTYNMSMKDEIEAFKDDFRLTACICTLKWFLQTYKSGGEKAVRSHDGRVDTNVIEFSLRRCAEFVKTKQHEDIDVAEATTVWEYQWDQFMTQYYKLVNDGQVLKDNREGVAIKTIVSNVQSMLNILKPYWPQFDIEGYQNFWIVKPGGRCCGAGIVIKNNLEQILLMVNPNSMRETRFVVQKYIERPLLIYNTKFDIRQWFLVTNVYPLTIWMYKESYLRFCSQPFTLKNTHESIHLCNNAVQRKYKNGKRDRGLPDENMWDCYTFQTYLKAIGHPDAWEKYIYPGMREAFIGALLASQDTMERKKNCFELYGADFMISDSLTDGPWLIEINSNPAMDSSTSVTARMCPQVLEDIIKVVIDRRENKSASTGAFEMVYKQNCPPIPPYLGMSLCIKGKKACRASEASVRALGRKIAGPPKLPGPPNRDASSSEGVNSARAAPAAVPAPDKLAVVRDTKKEGGTKRRKVDWVRKNIQDLRSGYSAKNSRTAPCASKSPSPRTRTASATEVAFRDHMLKLLGSMEMKEFVKEIIKMKKEEEEEGAKEAKKAPEEGEDLLIGRIRLSRKNADWCLDDLSAGGGVSEEVRDTLVRILQNFQQKAKGETEREDVFDNLDRLCRGVARTGTKSCPDFDSAFEEELRKVETEEKKAKKARSEESVESYLSAASCGSRTGSKTSLEYFREWKSKLCETRRTCQDMLAKLQQFQEENSKVKFQEAVRKRMKDEVEFIKRIRQLRKSKKPGRGRAGKREQRRPSEGRERARAEDARATSALWDCDPDGDAAPLAINSETGAVRNISIGLPKIKQRSRPLLPNGSSGHGRKIDVSLESAPCH